MVEKAGQREVVIIGSDAGGTMTDMFVVDEKGNFVIGKASTTPKREAIGFWNSIQDAFEYWDIDWEVEASKLLPRMKAIVYSGTAMINVLLTRTGQRIGLICPRGHEDTLLHERAKHTVAGYSLPDRLHVATHIHNEPLIPKRLIRGVEERIDVFGEVVIPLYEDQVREAVEYLLEEGVEGIIIWYFFSYLNPIHEQRTAEIAREIMQKKGKEVPLYLSSQACPIMREVSRLTSTLLQAYAAEPARKQLYDIEKILQAKGYPYPLQIVLSSGGIANIRYSRLHEAAFSGPIGGILGGRFLSEQLNMPNIVCTDMGGTSFDVGLIMGGEPIILREVELAHMIFNIPTVVMDTIGAGTGMYLRVDPETNRLELGPESAGADPGPVCYNMGNEIPTVIDCCLILGIINPDYYLGGKLKLYPELAYKAIKERCADPLGIDPYDFSEGVMDLINLRMREHINTVLSVRGYSPADYYLLAYGGAGPMFMANYAAGLPFKGIFTVPFAAAFSAFGCTATDFIHRYQKSTHIVIPPGNNEPVKREVGRQLNIGWAQLEEIALEEMKEEGIAQEDIILEPIAYMRYTGQMEDLEVTSPVRRINSSGDMDRLIYAFEEMYSRVYTYGAKYPEVGYQILEYGIRARAFKPKPILKKDEYYGIMPPLEAHKGERQVYSKKSWHKAKLYEMDLLKPGNEIIGLAIIESPATTLFVPQGKKIRVDEYRFLWLEEV
jgi:N-methylhydantoinase A